jgi:hypothetical protein
MVPRPQASFKVRRAPTRVRLRIITPAEGGRYRCVASWRERNAAITASIAC